MNCYSMGMHCYSDRAYYYSIGTDYYSTGPHQHSIFCVFVRTFVCPYKLYGHVPVHFCTDQ